MLTASDWVALALTLKLALVTTLCLLVIGAGLAYWLAHTKSRLSVVISSIAALPLVLPPTVMGFYLLLLLSPNGWLGGVAAWLGFTSFNFSFAGIVLASIIYSLPFAVQPLQQAFQSIEASQYESAQLMGANSWQQFAYVALPQAKLGFLTAAIMVYAHTLGEFGVVLMVGGNIEGVSRVVSIQIYDYVESLDYPGAHRLSLAVLMISFSLLFLLQLLTKRMK